MRSITVNINQRCPLRCKHCSLGFSESYRGVDTGIDANKLKDIIYCVDPEIYGMVLMAGGEPSLSPGLVRAGIQASKVKGLLSAIVTAPIWAPSVDTAGQFLDKISGLDMLILSYDDYHLEFLKWECYRNASLEAIKRRINVVFQVTFTREDQKKRLIDSLKGLRAMAQINPMRTVMIGNAKVSHLDAEHIEVSETGDLDRIPRGCVLGNAFIDEQLNVHGCCWSTAAEASPFSVHSVESLDGLGHAFHRLEENSIFQAVRGRGFIDALSDEARLAVVEAVSGERFSSECDLCIRIMRKETQHVWDKCGGSTRTLP